MFALLVSYTTGFNAVQDVSTRVPPQKKDWPLAPVTEPQFPPVMYRSSESFLLGAWLQPNGDGLQPNSDGLQPNSDGLQPKSDGLQPTSKAGFPAVAFKVVLTLDSP